MENKEIKNVAAELNDDALENVSGGLLVPILDWDPVSPEEERVTFVCALCKQTFSAPLSNYESRIANGTYRRDQNGNVCCYGCSGKLQYL